MENHQDLLKAFEEGSIQQTASFTHQDSFTLTQSVNLYEHLANKSSVNARKAVEPESLDLDLEALMGGAEDRPWSEQDWQWDPFSMQAQPRKAADILHAPLQQKQPQQQQPQQQQLQLQLLQQQRQLQQQQLQQQQLQLQLQQQLLQQQQQQQQYGEHQQSKRRKLPPSSQPADACDLAAAIQSNLAAAGGCHVNPKMTPCLQGSASQLPAAQAALHLSPSDPFAQLGPTADGPAAWRQAQQQLQQAHQQMRLQQLGSGAAQLEQYGSNRVWPSQPDSMQQPAPSTFGDLNMLQSNMSGNQAKAPASNTNTATWQQVLDMSLAEQLPLPQPLQQPQQHMGSMGIGVPAGPAALDPGALNPTVFSNPAFVPQPDMPAMPSGQQGRPGRAASDALAASLQMSPDSCGNHDTVALGSDDREKMVCQVPGCSKDLSGLKEYHQRYRICDVHIKLPQVMKDGRLQRFCQQCGRFHDLSAFDGNRKSCREQLNKHNARRRRRAQMEQQAAAPEDLSAIADEKSEVGRLLQALLQNPAQLQAFRVLLGLSTHPALPPLQPLPAEHTAPAAPAPSTATRPAAGAPAPPPAGADSDAEDADASLDPPSYAAARELASRQGQFAPSYESEHRSVRISLKLFDKQPSDLPGDLREQLTGWLAAAPAAMEGYIRPGCVFLTAQMLLPEAAAQAALQQGMGHLLRMVMCERAHSCWSQGTCLLQVGSEVAMVKDGTLMQRLIYTPRTAQDDGLPLLHRVEPLAVYGGQPISFTLRGHNLQQREQQVVCRSLGQHLYPTLEYLPPGQLEQQQQQQQQQQQGKHPLASRDSVRSTGTPRLGGSDSVKSRLGPADSLRVAATTAGKRHSSTHTAQQQQQSSFASDRQQQQVDEAVLCKLPPLPGCRLLQVEVCKRGFLSRCRPLLVLDDPALAAEVNSLLEPQQQALLSHQQRTALQHDLAAVLAHAQSGGHPSMDPHLVVHKAQRLLVLACDLGWPAVAARVLPVALSGAGSAAEAVAAVEAVLEGQEELTLLHRAVRSGSLQLVKGIMAWGEQHGYCWPIDKGGPHGLTPLHLAAMLDDDGVIALHLMDSCGPGAFTSAASDDGVTPFHLAFQMGHFVVDRVLQFMKDPDTLHVLEQHSLARQQLMVKPEGEGEERAARCIMRESNCLDACLACQSTVPPLLLSIIAHCARCGAQRPCLQAVEHERQLRQREAAAAAGRQPAKQPVAAGESSRARRAAARSKVSCESSSRSGGGGGCEGGSRAKVREAESEPGPCGEVGCKGNGCGHVNPSSCSHESKAVYEITAICQICHSNRVMQVN